MRVSSPYLRGGQKGFIEKLIGRLKWGFQLKKIFFIAISVLILSYPIYASDTSTVSVTAVVISNNDCSFETSNASLNFGDLDPSNPVERSVSTSIRFRCRGRDRSVTFFIDDDDGLYEEAPDANRMRHTTIPNEYLPYSFNLNPVSGTIPRRTWQTLTITGTIRGADYENAAMGSYSDTVTISIIP